MLRAGFIGFGRMGITHFSILNTHPLVNIAAVCDRSSTMLKTIKKYTAIRIYSDYREMINEEALNFVVISTPSDSHTEIIKIAIDNDLHTFVEKPFALTIAHGRETLAHLESKTLVNQVGYVNRFNEVFMEVKKLLDAGVIGEVKNFSSEMYGAIVLKDSKASWRVKRNTGGPHKRKRSVSSRSRGGGASSQKPRILTLVEGRISEKACHFVDFLTFMNASLPASVYATAIYEGPE